VDAALDDDFLPAARDVEEPRVVEEAEVAGAKVAVRRERLPGERLVPVVAVHEERTADLDLADDRRRRRRAAVAVRPALEDEVVGRLARRRDADLAVDGDADRVVHRRATGHDHRRPARRLREAVALVDRHPDVLLETLPEVGTERRGTTPRVAERLRR